MPCMVMVGVAPRLYGLEAQSSRFNHITIVRTVHTAFRTRLQLAPQRVEPFMKDPFRTSIEPCRINKCPTPR